MSQIERGVFRVRSIAFIDAIKLVYQAEKSAANSHSLDIKVPVTLAVTYNKLTVECDHLILPVEGESNVAARDYASCKLSLSQLAKSLRAFRPDLKSFMHLSVSESGVLVSLGQWKLNQVALERSSKAQSRAFALPEGFPVPRPDEFSQEYMLRFQQKEAELNGPEVDHPQQ